MTVVDSSAWLHYFKGTDRAESVAPYVEGSDALVPSVVVYEVYKVLRRDVSEDAADRAAAWLSQQTVVPLDERLALHAADVSLALRLPMADAVVYATAQVHEAPVVTSDKHFVDLPGVEYISEERE